MPDPPVSPSPSSQPAPSPPSNPTPPTTVSPHAPLPPITPSSNPSASPSPPQSQNPPTASLPSATVATNAPNAPNPANSATTPPVTSVQPSASTRPTLPPDSPSSAQRRTKGGRRAANPHLTEEERRRERVLKNRESAMKSLQKKKRYTEDLEHRAVALARRNAELKEKIRVLLIRLNGMSVNPGPLPMQAIHNTTTATPTFAQGNDGFRIQQQPQPQQPVFASGQSQTTNMNTAVQNQNKQNVNVQRTESASMVSNALPPQIGSASSNAPGGSSSFAALDEWVPNLSDAFLSPTPNALPPSAIMAAPSDGAFSSTQQTSNGNGATDVGDSFLGLGMGMGLGNGSTISSPTLGMQTNLQESNFGLSTQAESSDKIGTSFDLPHMACSQ